jgi:Na+-transporting methylmalonyl-CoA/oxaloacetate decarboxylase gamma subunit
MKALGLSMIVGGMAFLFSGLIFLLPTERKLSAREHSFGESQEEIEYYLRQMREERNEL